MTKVLHSQKAQQVILLCAVKNATNEKYASLFEQKHQIMDMLKYIISLKATRRKEKHNITRRYSWKESPRIY